MLIATFMAVETFPRIKRIKIIHKVTIHLYEFCFLFIFTFFKRLNTRYKIPNVFKNHYIVICFIQKVLYICVCFLNGFKIIFCNFI